MKVKTIAISTASFGEGSAEPLNFLKKHRFKVVMNPFRRKVSGKELLHFARAAHGLIAGLEELNAEVLGRMPNLKVISRCGAGLDNVDLKVTRRRGIRVYSTPEAATPAVAELAVTLMLDLLRGVSRSDRSVRNAFWEKRMGSLLKGKRVGIVGMGRIGRSVEKVVRAFGARTAYTDKNKKIRPAGVSRKSLRALLCWADIVTLHCSASAGQQKILLGKREIQWMKRGTFLINTARGGLVDEKALYAALVKKKIAGAALDVFSEEPYRGPLAKLEHVVLTPHIGSYARECRIEMERQAARHVIRGLR
jgi:D-3-phosphoglycerate dehydrogenase